MKKQSNYTSDLAKVHHSDYSDLAESAALTAIEYLRSKSVSNGLIIDLGCGSGVTAQILTAAGYDVIGVDYSKDILKIAKKHAPGATFICQSIFDFTIPKCEAVLSIGEVFNYAFDNRVNKPMLQNIFSRVYNALKPGGLFLFDVLTPGTLGTDNYRKRIIETHDYTMFLKVEENTDEKTLTRDICLFTRQNDLYRKTRETHQQKLYKVAEVEKSLDSAGFEYKVFQKYKKYTLRNCHIGFLCTK